MDNEVTIREYVPGDEDAVVGLLRLIYPLDRDLPERMAYDPGPQSHVTTLLAFIGGELVGQTNVFRVDASSTVANL